MRSLAKRLLEAVLAHPRVDDYLRRRHARTPWDYLYPAGHFFSPQPDISEVEARAHELFRKDVDLRASINLREEAQRALLDRFTPYYTDFRWPDDPTPEYRYYLRNSWFAHGDALVLYCMVRHLKPRRVIEVGSGFSSAIMLDTNDRHLAPRATFTFIDPYPQRLHELLRDGDRKICTVLVSPVQRVPVSTFLDLG